MVIFPNGLFLPWMVQTFSSCSFLLQSTWTCYSLYSSTGSRRTRPCTSQKTRNLSYPDFCTGSILYEPNYQILKDIFCKPRYILEAVPSFFMRTTSLGHRFCCSLPHLYIDPVQTLRPHVMSLGPEHLFHILYNRVE